jgi:hypothetical protein
MNSNSSSNRLSSLDFERALQIEPGNKLIIEELDKLGPVVKVGITKEP